MHYNPMNKAVKRRQCTEKFFFPKGGCAGRGQTKPGKLDHSFTQIFTEILLCAGTTE